MTAAVARITPREMLQALACWALEGQRAHWCDCGECDECIRIAQARPVLERLCALLDKTDTASQALAVAMAALTELLGAGTGELLAAVIAAHAMRAHGADAGCLEREMALTAAEGSER